VMFENYFYWFI